MRILFLVIFLFAQFVSASDDINEWSVKTIATEKVIYTSPSPEDVYAMTPGIAVCPNGRIVAIFQLSGKGINKINEVKNAGRTYIYVSDDHGQSWRHTANIAVMHARPFVAGDKVYIIGHENDVKIAASDDWGDTWSDCATLTKGEFWHASATNIWYKGDNVYLVMEKRIDRISDAWPVAELIPVAMRGNIKSDLLKKENWTFANADSFHNYVDDKKIDTLFGIPFFPCYYPDRYMFPNAGKRSFSPIGWLESNIVQITDSRHYLFDPTGNTFHIFMRANTGLTNIACLMKAVEHSDGSITTEFQKAPSGQKLLFVAMPGGQMRFHILYDKKTKLYWLLSTQTTDSMTRADLLPKERFGAPDNERSRMQLHFSKNMFDWCFAGLVAVGSSDKQARHYAAMEFDGNDIVILSRSGNQDAKSAHNGNLITFHKIKNFRRLIY